MPMSMHEKRRSLHITNNVKLSDVTKETPIRPRSWYVSVSNSDFDRYSSVRKIFYEFPKKEFYGDQEDRIITNNNVSLDQREPNISDKNETINEQNLKNTLQVTDYSPSPVPSCKSAESDTNNNTISPSESKNNVKHKTYFSPSKTSDTVSLKEESSNYAEFYVPNAPKTPTSNFLRRSNKRRSFDPSKFKALDYIKNVDDEEDDVFSVVSGNISCVSPSSTDLYGYKKSRDVDPKPMIERYLRDTAVYIYEGVYPPADDSTSIQSDSRRLITGKVIRNQTKFIPWTKRFSLIKAKIYVTEQPFSKRRNSRKFSSLRLSKTTNEHSKSSFVSTLRRSHAVNDDPLKSFREFSSIRRHHSESSASFKKRRMSSQSISSRISQDFSTLLKDAPRALLRQRSSKRNKMEARYFFHGYEDKLREENFSIDFPSSCDSTPLSATNGLYEHLSKDFDLNLLGKTYRQLFYVRSRLSESAKSSQFVCDGCFGCDADVQSTSPQWV